jgi:C-terminal processing protease CtpA/Prc
VIARVARGSPADTAGLKVGDRLVELHTVEEAVAFEDTLNSPEDTELSVEIERAGVRSNVTLKLKDWL